MEILAEQSTCRLVLRSDGVGSYAEEMCALVPEIHEDERVIISHGYGRKPEQFGSKELAVGGALEAVTEDAFCNRCAAVLSKIEYLERVTGTREPASAEAHTER
jgi:hypothetical protein